MSAQASSDEAQTADGFAQLDFGSLATEHWAPCVLAAANIPKSRQAAKHDTVHNCAAVASLP